MALDDGFGPDHLPYGIFATDGTAWRVGVRIGDGVLDLAAAARAARPEWLALFRADALNPLLAAGKPVWDEVRAWVQRLPVDELVPLDRVRMRLPFDVADYVDFYASLDHATSVGRIFRPGAEPLPPNWRHLPVSYHGRAGSVVVSGTDLHRPKGQRKAPDEMLPSFGPSRRLDLEAELGFVVGRAVPLGEGATVVDFERTVFGVVGLNDWSARDIQAWEYVPLGPHLGKSFGTTISAWVTPLAALESARVPLGEQQPPVLGYLRQDNGFGYDLAVEVELNGEVVSRPNYRHMYWSPAQMLAHMTVNGASLRVGDLYGSGTISGPGREERGCLLELSWGGAEPFAAGGRPRTFLDDGDEVVLRYRAANGITLGEVRGRILPAR